MLVITYKEFKKLVAYEEEEQQQKALLNFDPFCTGLRHRQLNFSSYVSATSCLSKRHEEQKKIKMMIVNFIPDSVTEMLATKHI